MQRKTAERYNKPARRFIMLTPDREAGGEMRNSADSTADAEDKENKENKEREEDEKSVYR